MSADDVDEPRRLAADTTKASLWAAIAGLANLFAIAFAPGFFPAWYFLLIAIGYALLLPAIAILHVRHQAVRASGAVLATAAGTCAIAVGIAASAAFDLVTAALLVRGVWWWTIGKMWNETAVLPRSFGLVTMVLAVVTLGIAVSSPLTGTPAAATWASERLIVGVWSLALAFYLTRSQPQRVS